MEHEHAELIITKDLVVSLIESGKSEITTVEQVVAAYETIYDVVHASSDRKHHGFKDVN